MTGAAPARCWTNWARAKSCSPTAPMTQTNCASASSNAALGATSSRCRTAKTSRHSTHGSIASETASNASSTNSNTSAQSPHDTTNAMTTSLQASNSHLFESGADLMSLRPTAFSPCCHGRYESRHALLHLPSREGHLSTPRRIPLSVVAFFSSMNQLHHRWRIVSSPAELAAVDPYSVHDDRQSAGKSDCSPLSTTAFGNVHRPRFQP